VDVVEADEFPKTLPPLVGVDAEPKTLAPLAGVADPKTLPPADAPPKRLPLAGVVTVPNVLPEDEAAAVGAPPNVLPVAAELVDAPKTPAPLVAVLPKILPELVVVGVVTVAVVPAADEPKILPLDAELPPNVAGKDCVTGTAPPNTEELPVVEVVPNKLEDCVLLALTAPKGLLVEAEVVEVVVVVVVVVVAVIAPNGTGVIVDAPKRLPPLVDENVLMLLLPPNIPLEAVVVASAAKMLPVETLASFSSAGVVLAAKRLLGAVEVVVVDPKKPGPVLLLLPNKPPLVLLVVVDPNMLPDVALLVVAPNKLPDEELPNNPPDDDDVVTVKALPEPNNPPEAVGGAVVESLGFIDSSELAMLVTGVLSGASSDSVTTASVSADLEFSSTGGVTASTVLASSVPAVSATLGSVLIASESDFVSSLTSLFGSEVDVNPPNKLPRLPDLAKLLNSPDDDVAP